jgi:hypothetical protein
MTLNRKLSKLVKHGLFVALPSPKPARRKKKAAPKTRKLYQERKPVLFYEKGDLNVIEAKQQRDITIEDPQPFDGIAKRDAADGWGEFVDDPELYPAAICIVPMSDGTRKRLYRMMIRPDVLAKKKKRVANLLRDIERDDAKAAKRRVRAMLVMMGKA